MSNLPAPTEGLPIHGPFVNLSASDTQRQRYFLRCWSRLIGAVPCPVDTGLVHGPMELDEYNALPACVCAGTGYHNGQSVECCDECRPDLF